MNSASTTSFLSDSQFVGALLAAVIAAVVAAIIAVYQFWQHVNDRRKTALAALFAELAHIERHYEFSSAELRRRTPPHPPKRRLLWSKYGTVAGSSNLKENAILGPQQMAEVLQISLVIRNTDTLIDEILAQGQEPSQDDLNIVADRMMAVAGHARSLSQFIYSRMPRLGAIRLD